MIPLVALFVVAADPLLAIEDLLVFLKIHLLAIVAVLLLVVGLGALITQPKGLIVWVLLARPETRGLGSIRHVLFRANYVFTPSQVQLGHLLLLVNCIGLL